MGEIRFLNIDLDIESTVDVSLIVEEWGDRICVFRHEEVDGIYYGSFETACSGVTQIIDEYVSLINGLSSAARKIWDNASKRDFDFGYGSGTIPNNFHYLSKLLSKWRFNISLLKAKKINNVY